MIIRYNELYELMAESKKPEYMHSFGKAEKRIFEVLAERYPAIAEDWLSELEGMEYKHYLTRQVAENMAMKLIHKSGTKGAEWSVDDLMSALKAWNMPAKEEMCFNEYMLYYMMNKVYAHHSDVIKKWAGKDNQEIVKLVYDIAVSEIKAMGYEPKS